MRHMSLVGLLLALSAGPALAQATTAKGSDGHPYLQAPSGMTLYVFDKDHAINGQPAGSTCYDQCAQAWPPFIADASATPSGDWTLDTRRDGAKQWAYKGRPLYMFARDKKAGEQQGNSFDGNSWHVAQP